MVQAISSLRRCTVQRYLLYERGVKYPEKSFTEHLNDPLAIMFQLHGVLIASWHTNANTYTDHSLSKYNSYCSVVSFTLYAFFHDLFLNYAMPHGCIVCFNRPNHSKLVESEHVSTVYTFREFVIVNVHDKAVRYKCMCMLKADACAARRLLCAFYVAYCSLAVERWNLN